MKKRLNTEAITNELAGNSAFFPDYQGQDTSVEDHVTSIPSVSEEPQVPVTKQATTAASSSSPTVSAKRSFVRRSFDLYEDQIAFLTRVSLEERLAGKEGSMNAMVREALDNYIKKRKAGK